MLQSQIGEEAGPSSLLTWTKVIDVLSFNDVFRSCGNKSVSLKIVLHPFEEMSAELIISPGGE